MLNLHKDKYTLAFDDKTHTYLVNGQRKPSVTGIIKILDKPGLPQWAANQAVDYLSDNAKPFPEYEGEQAWIVTRKDLNLAKKAHRSSRDDSATVGKAVHAWIEHHIRLSMSKVDKGYVPRYYTEAMEPSIKAFQQWERKFKPRYIYSERVVYCNEGQYCGTSDLGCFIQWEGKEIYIIPDLKTGHPENEFKKYYTGRKRVYTTTYLQDALYDIGIEEEDGTKADAYGGIYISTDGSLFFGVVTNTEPFRELGKSLVQTYRLLNAANEINEWK